MPSPDPCAVTLPQPLIVIVGPTGVGKTEIAIHIAEKLGGEIVSADSRLFYRGMDIGTAKPTPAQRARVPHHLIDVADPDQVWSLASFQEQAQQTIKEICTRKRLPILVGGTGQYVRAIIEGWLVPRVKPVPKMRAVLENWAKEVGNEALHARLAILDPQSAANIDYRNLRRTIRAIEVILTTGETFSQQRQKIVASYKLLRLGLTRPREELYSLIDERIEGMFNSGFVEEVQGLIEQGYSPDLPSFSAIGYQEVSKYLAGKMTMEEAIVRMKRLTRQFVRQQANWFKETDPRIKWFNVGPDTIEELQKIIQDWLPRTVENSSGFHKMSD